MPEFLGAFPPTFGALPCTSTASPNSAVGSSLDTPGPLLLPFGLHLYPLRLHHLHRQSAALPPAVSRPLEQGRLSLDIPPDALVLVTIAPRAGEASDKAH